MRRIRALVFSSRGQAGFILPGVIMFIFVLTIIGLSLFSLSSYEAQFMYASMNDAQAFYDASGAIDRARFLLRSTKDMAKVKTMVGTGNITYAVAKQGNDSIGTWTDIPPDPILVRVLVDRTDSNNKHHRRFLEGSFDPSAVEMYDKLFSMSSTARGLRVMEEGGTSEQCDLYGTLWQTFAGLSFPHWHSDIYDLAHLGTLQEEVGPPFPPVPSPQVATFLAKNFASGVAPQEPSSDDFLLDASAAMDSIQFFSTSSLAVHGPGASITVRGIAVWMFDQDLTIDKTVTINGTAADMLVLCVRGTAAQDSVPALELRGGINSPNVPVILVSEHRILIENNPNGNFSTTVNWLCVYAPSAWIWGPTENNPTLRLTYSHGTHPQAEANLDKLFARRALPNATGPRNGLAFRPGSWREVTDPNPN